MLFSLGLGIDDDYYKIHDNNDASGNVIALLVDKVNHIFGKPFSWHAKCEVPFIMDFKIQIQKCLTIGFFIWIRFNYNLIYKYEKFFFHQVEAYKTCYSGDFFLATCKSTYLRSVGSKDRVHGAREELNLDY